MATLVVFCSVTVLFQHCASFVATNHLRPESHCCRVPQAGHVYHVSFQRLAASCDIVKSRHVVQAVTGRKLEGVNRRMEAAWQKVASEQHALKCDMEIKLKVGLLCPDREPSPCALIQCQSVHLRVDWKPNLTHASEKL